MSPVGLGGWPKGRLVLGGLLCLGVLGGLGLFLALVETPAAPEGKPSGQPIPWFKTQAPPPGSVPVARAKLPPLLPEESPQPPRVPPRAYEEALPAAIYEPPPVVATPPPGPPGAGPLPLWRQNAVAWSAAAKGDLVAIVIDDMGLDRRRSARAIALPAPLTLSFLAYADGLETQTARARAAGHELMLHVSMEPLSATVDPGPKVLLTGLGEARILERLRWDLGRFQGYVGINNHMGSRFTADQRGMNVVLAEIKRRGLLFLDSRTSTRTVGAALARRLGVPHAERNVFLDNLPVREAVEQRLIEVERVAIRHGLAVAIGHPRDATLEALAAWLPGLAEKGLTPVPVSAVVALRLGITLAERKPAP